MLFFLTISEKMFKCNNCHYTSNYKSNVKRHQMLHDTNSSIIQNNQPSSLTIKHPSSNMKINDQQIDASYPVQALNLANNIHIPPTTKQVINIQPPANVVVTPTKKPVIHDANKKYFDIRLKENFKLFISGPSRSGKTVFVKKLIDDIDIFTHSPPTIITLVYKVFQPIYYNMNIDHLVLDGDDLKERLINIANGEPMLIIFDDLINSNSLSDLANLFVVDGRHMNFSMVFISQKLFVNNDHYRQISLNCDYYVVFKNPRNALEIRNLASQMTPGKMELVTYYTEATKHPFSYLFINLTQECEYQVKYLSYLFNTPHTVQSYSDSSTKELIDGLNNGRTNFKRLYINNTALKMTNMDKTYSNAINHSSDRSIPAVMDKRDNTTSINDAIKDVNIMTDVIDKRDAETSTNGKMENVSTMSDLIGKRDFGTSTNVNSEDVGTMSDKIYKKDYATSTHGDIKDESTMTHLLNKMDNSTYTDRLMRDVGITTDVIEKKNMTTSTITPMKNASVSMNLPMYDQGVSTNMIDMRNVGTTTDGIQSNIHDYPMEIYPVSNTSSNSVISYDNRHSLYSDRDMAPIHVRPERQWRLNAPIYSLIRRPSNLYRNYNTYMHQGSLTHETNHDDEEVLTHENDITNALTYEYGVPKAITYENTIVPYHDYNYYTDDATCTQCDEVFHSTNALKRHQPSCKPSVYACNVCGKNLLTRNSLTRHIRAMHQNRRDIRSVEQKFT